MRLLFIARRTCPAEEQRENEAQGKVKRVKRRYKETKIDVIEREKGKNVRGTGLDCDDTDETRNTPKLKQPRAFKP